MSGKRIIGVIPARLASSRFPEKCIAPIAGIPLVVRVMQQAQKASLLDDICVAVDDERIAAVVREHGGNAILTDPDLPSGTDRIAAAIREMKADGIVNIQGDEPLIEPSLIDALALILKEDAAWDMATAATPIRTAEELAQPNIVKVVWGLDGQALYFSRSPIPFIRDAGPSCAPVDGVHWRHIGIYAYQRSFLERLVKEPPCLLENMEKLEQLRALSLGCRMKVVPTDYAGVGVDRPEDVATVEAILAQK